MTKAARARITALDLALSRAQDACGAMVTVEARESADAGDRATHRIGTDIWSELEKLRHQLYRIK